MTTREKALEYIDRCTHRCGFIIGVDSLREAMVDAFCLGYDDDGNEIGVRSRAEFIIMSNKKFEPASLFLDARIQLIDLYEAGHITRLKELEKMREELQEEEFWRERVEFENMQNYDYNYGDVKY